jgi:hypothetical protein
MSLIRNILLQGRELFSIPEIKIFFSGQNAFI